MKVIYNSIRKDILNNPKIKNSVLGMVKEWKRSHYIILSEIISEKLASCEELQDEKKYELGNTISHITLQRFFENEYQYKTHNDLRFIKTLDKICIFLGYKNLNAYIKHHNPKSDKVETIQETDIKNLIYNYSSSLFEALSKFPILSLDVFSESLFSNAPLLERLKLFGTELCDRKFELITKNNRSNYEIYDIRIIVDEPDKKVIETKEFWNLLFKEGVTNKKHFFNLLDTQVYFVHKIDNIWKIWDNYNPSSGIINETIKES